MADNLTLQIIEDLKKRRESSGKSSSSTLEQSSGLSLYEQLSSSKDEEIIPSDMKSGALHGVGALMWNALDSALLGVPGIAAKKADIDFLTQYDMMEGKTKGLAKAGAITGQALGFLAPMKAIGLGVRGAVSAVNKVGTSKLIGEAAEKAGKFASKGDIGLSREIAEKAVKRGLRDPKLKGPSGALTKYELSLDEIAKVENEVKGSIFNSLKREFADQSDDVLLDITNTATGALKKKGVHVNNLTDVIEAGLNTTLGVKTKSKLTRYVARAAETGTTFGVYNLIQDGVLAISSEKEFDPVSDVTDAFLFSAFLPVIDMIPGGGKVQIMRTAKRLRNSLKKVKKRDYDNLSKDEANALLTILTRDSYLAETKIGSTAKKYSYKQLEKEEAISAVKKVIGEVDINTIWKKFASEAGEDFSKSLGRMLVGGLYFDGPQSMELIRALPGDEILAHFLVGAFFSKMHRPLFQEKYPHINSEFNDRARALEYLGLDTKSLEHYGRAFSDDMHWGAAYSGMLGNPTVQQIESIFEKQEYRNQQEGEKWEGTINSVGDIPNRDKIALYAHNIYEMASLSRNISSARAGDSHIRLESLTPIQIQKIAEDLSKVKISETENLTIENFDKFKIETMGEGLKNVGILHMEAMRDIADKIRLQYDDPVGGFNIDAPFRMARLDGILNNEKITDKNFHELSLFSSLRERLQEIGLVETIKVPPKEMLRIENVSNTPEDKAFIKDRIDEMLKQITIENYGENYPEQIKPLDNTFLLAIQNYKLSKKRDALFNIAEGEIKNLSEKEQSLYFILKEQFGDKVPKSADGNRVRVTQGETNDKEWNKSEIDGSVLDIENQINLLARVWGTGGQRTEGPLRAAKDGKMEYETAKNIVESFRAQGYDLDNKLVEEQQAWHYSKILNSPHITSNHISILESMFDKNFARTEVRNGRRTLIIPDKTAVRNQLKADGFTDKEISSYLEKFDKSMEALQRITGDYIDVSNEVDYSQTENFAAAIDDMYRMTGSFNTEIYNEYNDIKNKNNNDLQKLDDVKGIIDLLFIEDPIDGTIERKVVDDKQMLEDIQLKLDKIQQNPPKFVPKSLLENLRKLRDVVTIEQQDEARTRGVTTIAKIIENSINEEFGNLYEQNTVFDEILFNAQNFSHDRIQLKNRTDQLTSRLKKELENNFDEFMPQSATLTDVINEYNKKGRGDKATKMLLNYVEIWNKGYDEITYFEQQAKEQERLGDYSTQDARKQQDVSPSTITARYEQYNPILSRDSFKTLLESHNNSQSRDEFKKGRKSIRDEIIGAIYVKHNVVNDTPEKDLPKEFIRERQDFLENTYPQLILQQIGRDYISSAKLFQNEDGSPTLEVGRTTIGKGLLSDFAKEMKDIGVQVLMLEKTATWKSRKRDINDIKDLDSQIKNALIQSESFNQIKQVLNKEEPSESSITDKFGDPVRVPVSQNTELIIGNTTVDGRLTRKFKEWYDNKISYLENKKPKGYQDTIRHLKMIYGDFIKDVNSPVARMDAKQMVRAMYWDKVSSNMFDDIVAVADKPSEMQGLASSFFKYVSLGEATGAKSQASEQFLRVMKEDGFISNNQEKAIDYYLAKKGLNIVGVGDEVKGSPLDAQYVIKDKLKKLKDLGNLPKDQEAAVGKLLKSLESSSINAQSYLGTNAAHLMYMHKGRRIDDSSNKFGTAGVKPTGWFNQNGESVLLKTNFVYDPAIAKVLDKADIDILTNQSAAKSFNREYVEISKSEFNGMKNKDALDIATLAAGKHGPRNISQIGLENLFLGKVEDRKTLTSSTYAMTDFLPEIGYKSFLNDFVDYDTKINNHLGKLADIVTGNKDALSTARHLLNELSEQNALFEHTSDGLLNHQIRAGLDPNSILANESLKRIAVRGLVNSLRKPKTDGASNSILVPYIEGSIPIYDNINDVANRKQIMLGGKKLSYDDSQSIVSNVNKMQYVVTISQPTKDSKSPVKRDVQLGRDNLGNWVVEDPYDTADKKSLQKQIQKIKEFESKHSSKRTLEKIYNELNLFNKSKEAKGLGTELYLHSLSLRMPNLGGDVAVHKVEGFYRKEQGNIVGVNAFDIAQIHQADFDVDAMFSYNLKPTELSNIIYKESGLSLDAYIFPSDNFSMDMFGFGDEVGRAGRAFTQGDNLDKHIQAFHQSKMNFGVVKKLSTQLSGYLRSPDLIDFGGNVKMINAKKENREDYGHFLQGYKNTLQSIIDAAKKPNWASEANSDDITRYILFGDKPDGYNIGEGTNYRESDFYQDKFKGFFQVDANLPQPQQAIMKDAIMEVIKTQSRTQRVLTDVFDAAGRRPPDANEIGMIKSELNNFYGDPNKFIYDRLRYKYRGNVSQLVRLNKMFYGDDLNNIQSWIELSKNNKTLSPTEDVIFINPKNIKALKDNSISSYIVSRFTQDKASLQGWSNRTTQKGSIARQRAFEVLERIDIATSLSGGEKDSQIREILEDEGFTNGLFLDDYFKTFRAGQVVNEKKLRDYSLMISAFQKDAKSLQRFIDKAGKHDSSSVGRARRKLNHIENFMDYVSSWESNLIKNISSGDRQKHGGLIDKYHVETKNFKQRSGRVYNNNRSKPLYVYRRLEKSGRTYFQQAGWVEPGGSKQFHRGYEYHVLKNPIRYEEMSKSDFLDAYSLISVTGDIQVQHLGFSETQELRFVRDFHKLSRTFGSLISNTIKYNKNNPEAKENWQLERYQEDALVRDFIEKFSKADDARDDIDFTNTQFSSLVRYMIKPEPVFGTFVHSKNENVRLPAYKINKRMVNAVSRYMLQNGHAELFDAIYGEYGREYRRRVHNVIPEDTKSMFESKLYYKDDSYFRTQDDPTLELIVDNKMIYDNPAMQNHYRHTLGRKADLSKVKYDMDGNLEYVMKYGSYKEVMSDMEFYKDNKNFMEKDNKNETECW